MLDYDNMQNSDIWQSKYLGGSSASEDDFCVNDGVAAGWNSTFLERPKPLCLRRCMEWYPLETPENLTTRMNLETTYDGFRKTIESSIHQQVHMNSGGQCNSTLDGDMVSFYSTNDPFFFIHHATMDRIWWRWQKDCRDFKRMYDGFKPDGITPVSYDEELPGLGVPVVYSLDTNKHGMCYEYSQSDGDLPLSLNCPNYNFLNSLSWTNSLMRFQPI
jgi:tyrosinase